MRLPLLCLLSAIAFESSIDCQIKGGEWLQEAQIESGGWGIEIGHLMISGPVLPSGEETVFVKWWDAFHPSGPTVYSLLKLPTLQQVWSFGSTDSWGLEFSGDIVSDFNGDGVDDILVGLERTERVWLLDGLTGAQLFEIAGPPNSEFGHQVFQIWDVDSDGTPDWGIYSPEEYAANGFQGLLYLYSGISGAHVRTLAPSDLNRGIGRIFSTAHDWDGDGFGDFFCWDYYSQLLTGKGLLVRSGLDGAILHDWNTDYGITTMLTIPGFGGDQKPQVELPPSSGHLI